MLLLAFYLLFLRFYLFLRFFLGIFEGRDIDLFLILRRLRQRLGQRLEMIGKLPHTPRLRRRTA